MSNEHPIPKFDDAEHQQLATLVVLENERTRKRQIEVAADIRTSFHEAIREQDRKCESRASGLHARVNQAESDIVTVDNRIGHAKAWARGAFWAATLIFGGIGFALGLIFS